MAAFEAENARLKEELAAAEQRSKRLAAELQRHLNNALAIMRSVVRRTARGAGSVEDYVMHLDSQLGAIARGQAMAMRTLLAGGVDLDALLAEELLAHTAHEDGQVTLAGPPVKLRAATAATLGLAFHELALNAVIHGALSTPSGRIAVRWEVEPARRDRPAVLVLAWEESGGPPPPRERRRGFGTEMVERMLAYELRANAALQFGAEGLRWVMELPLTDGGEPLGRA